LIHQSLVVNYRQDEVAQGPLLMIEQEEWGRNVGVVTTAEMLRYVSAVIYNQLYQKTTDCGMVDGQLTCTINVYTSRPGLAYQLHTSWGTVTGPAGGLVSITEILNFTLTTEERPKYPVRTMDSVRWLSDCYDSTGAIVNPPALTIGVDNVTIPDAVYGSVEVSYKTERYQHTLSVPKRDDAIEEMFSAAVYALYDGGVVWEKISMPRGFDENTAAVKCGLSGSVSVTWPEGDPRPVADSPYRRRTIVDYCSQTTISDTIS